MNRILYKTITYSFIVAILAGTVLVSCNNKPMDGMLVATKIPAGNFSINEETDSLNLPGAKLVAVDPEDADAEEIILTPDFYSACSPHLSYDARQLLFLGQKKQDDPWQVWELNLSNKNYRQLTDFEESCYSPFYLPGKQFVFSKDISDTITGSSRMLFTMNLDGTNLQQITFHPHKNYVQTILNDGRIVMLSQQIYPERGKTKILAMRPNGTKTEIFHAESNGVNRGLKFHETNTGIIYFTEQDSENPNKRNLVSIHQNRPLNSKVNYTEKTDGSIYSVFPISENELFVSYRRTNNHTIGLYKFSTDKKRIEETLLDDTDYHYLEPVLIESYQRPSNLPDELKSNFPTGLIMCQNINMVTQNDTLTGNFSEATKIEVLGTDRSLGIVPVEADGSFFLKIKADLPFRIQTIGENNEVIREPSDWIWVRPFERRGCVGCHEDHELAPENVVPMAVNQWPVLIPADSINMELNNKTFDLGDMH